MFTLDFIHFKYLNPIFDFRIVFIVTDGILNFEAFNLCYTGNGLFGVYGVVDDPAESCFDFCDTIIYNFHRLSRQIPDAELEAAKSRLINQHLINTDGMYPI